MKPSANKLADLYDSQGEHERSMLERKQDK